MGLCPVSLPSVTIILKCRSQYLRAILYCANSSVQKGSAAGGRARLGQAGVIPLPDPERTTSC